MLSSEATLFSVLDADAFALTQNAQVIASNKTIAKNLFLFWVPPVIIFLFRQLSLCPLSYYHAANILSIFFVIIAFFSAFRPNRRRGNVKKAAWHRGYVWARRVVGRRHRVFYSTYFACKRALYSRGRHRPIFP